MRWLCAAVGLLSAAVVAPAHAERPPVRSVTLGNGLRVLLAPDSLAAAVDVGVWYGADPQGEIAGKSGLSYLFGRLMFRGSRSFPAGEHKRLLEAEGATVNLIVNPDFSCFYETLPPRSVERALELEADRMASLRITREALDAERREVREERRRRLEAGPAGRGLEKLYATAFAGHPYERPVIGVGADLERFTLEDAEEFYRQGYRPDNATLTVVGDFDPVATLAAIRRRFEALPRGAASAAKAPSVPEQREARRVTEVAATPTPFLMVGWRGPAAADPDNPALEMLTRILTAGRSSRLNRVMTAKGRGFIYAEGDFDRRRQASLFVCVTALEAGADTAKAEQALVSEIEKLAAEPVPAELLERAKRRMECDLLFDLQSARGLAQSLGSAQMLAGDPGDAERRLGRMRRLAPEDLRRAAASYLVPAGRSVVLLMPAGGSAAPPARKERRP